MYICLVYPTRRRQQEPSQQDTSGLLTWCLFKAPATHLSVLGLSLTVSGPIALPGHRLYITFLPPRIQVKVASWLQRVSGGRGTVATAIS